MKVYYFLGSSSETWKFKMSKLFILWFQFCILLFYLVVSGDNCYSFLFVPCDQVANLKCLLCHFRTETLFTKSKDYYGNMVCQDPCYYSCSIFKPFEKSIDHSLWDLLSPRRPIQEYFRTFTGNMGETSVLSYITLKVRFSLPDICYCCISFSNTAGSLPSP